MNKPLLILSTALLLASGLSFAEGTATYDASSDVTITTAAPAGTHSSDTTSKALETQKNNWDKIADKTGKDISYSYKYVCDSGGSCMTVDPPRFQR